MKIELWVIGKTKFVYLEEGIALYQKRLKHYIPFGIRVIPDLKNTKHLKAHEIVEREGKLLLDQLPSTAQLILLDERGKQKDSLQFSQFLDQQMQQATKHLIFVIGGAYGFSEAVYQQAKLQLSLSKMTFSHQMIRLFFVEQLYRAMTILRNEPYHHA